MSGPESAERWAPVPGFEGAYEVSDHGRVRSVDRVTVYQRVRRGRLAEVTRRHRGHLLSPGTVKSGHQLVVLGRGNSRLVHALVLMAFVGPRPPGADSLHWDGDPANNRLANLRWGTRAENVADALRHGTHRGGGPSGEQSPRAILTEAAVKAIRADARPAPILAAEYGVRPTTISKVRARKIWAHVEDAAA